MKYTFKGSLCGSLCEDCTEPLDGIEVFLYLPWQKERILENAIAKTKETFRIVTKEEATARKGLLIATTKSDAQGNFEFAINEKYGSTAFDIDFSCGTVPRTPPRPPRREPIQVHLTTIFPQWRMDRAQEGSFFQWEYCIPSKWWCYVRGFYFDAWVICGHLRNCQTGVPIARASVTAWDADFITDDNLGTAITDSNGHFRIDYTSIQFKQTFLSPWLNVETDPGPSLTFQSGPDVYFKASIGGVTLIDETAKDCRNNVGYCLCVDLCTKIGDADDPNLPSIWVGIGREFYNSTGAGPRDFDVNGYAGASSGKFALTGVIRLTGSAARNAVSGNPVEYRFLVSHVTTPNGGAPHLIGNFSKIVGVTPNLFAPSLVATLVQIAFPNTPYAVISDQTDFDADGWFDINHAIERTLVNNGFTMGDLHLFAIWDEDTLIAMNTYALTTGQFIPAPVVNAGTPVPGGHIPIEKVAIRFEVREVVNKPANIFNAMPGNGKTLNSAIMNNNSMFMKLSIAELEVSGLCAPISGTVHAKYTVYHPHLASSSLHLKSNSGGVDKDISDALFLPLSGNTNPAIEGGANSNLTLNDSPNDLIRCTYSLKLWAQARLHNGDNAWGDSGPVEQLFFYDI